MSTLWLEKNSPKRLYMSWDMNNFEETMQRSGVSKMNSQAVGKPQECGDLEGK